MTFLSNTKKICEAASPGRWLRHPNKRFWILLPEDREYTQAEHDSNAEFCAHARTALPRCVELLERALPYLKTHKADSEDCAFCPTTPPGLDELIKEIEE